MDNQLIVNFGTGADDLRGGNDNVHVVVLLRSSAPLRFDNVNERRRWANKSNQRIARLLPGTLRFDDIVGVRLETTLSGGIGGDNWNLDRIAVAAQIAGETRTLYEASGTPLVRFTGDKRTHEFLVSPGVVPAPAPRVMTRFRPEQHGFRFVNDFKNLVISELNFTTGGLCGGMSYAALDYWHAAARVPQQDYMPAEGSVLQSYLYSRQVRSLLSNVDKWAEIGFNPSGIRNLEFFNWGLQMGAGRLGELRLCLDKGQAVPLGLQPLGNDVRTAPGHHQVVAIGYELGRYGGDLASHVNDVSIFVYDPNHPARVMTLKPNVDDAMYCYAEDRRYRWRTYFVDMKYGRATPPEISLPARELMVEFRTGTDDLRGGKDNVHVVVLMRSGAAIRFDNVNEGKRWLDRSSQTISRALPESVRFEDMSGIRLETTFGGGVGGDNWNIDTLRVRARLGSETRTLYTQSGDSGPLVRFTGTNRVREFRF